MNGGRDQLIDQLFAWLVTFEDGNEAIAAGQMGDVMIQLIAPKLDFAREHEAAAFELAKRLGATNAHLAHFVRVMAANEGDRLHEERLRRLVNSEKGWLPGAVHTSDVAFLLRIIDNLRLLLGGKDNEGR
jgi:hypothetical protein